MSPDCHSELFILQLYLMSNTGHRGIDCFACLIVVSRWMKNLGIQLLQKKLLITRLEDAFTDYVAQRDITRLVHKVPPELGVIENSLLSGTCFAVLAETLLRFPEEQDSM